MTVVLHHLQLHPVTRAALVVGATLLGVCSIGAQTALAQSAASKSTSIASIKGSATNRAQLDPSALGDFSRDSVFTTVTPCRLVDTRNAGGQIGTGATRTFDLDGSNLSAQGGSGSGCNIPSGVAAAAAVTITVTNPGGGGYLTAWGLGTQPFSSVLNFVGGQTIANTTIIPVVPGGGNDFSIFASVNTDVVIDVVGYFAAPAATSHSIAALAGTWTATLTGFNGCGSTALHITYTLNTSGSGTGTLTQHASCGDTTVAAQTFAVQSLNANGSGTANLSCGAGCGYNLRIQVAPDRQVMNLVDVDSANPGNYIAGVAVRQ